MTSTLDQLKQFSTIVADTVIHKYEPTDATTNPSLLLKAAQSPSYEHIVRETIDSVKGTCSEEDTWGIVLDKLVIKFGTELLKIIPGRVSTEIDASLSFDTQATIEKAIKIVSLYESEGIKKNRIYIKIASTWEGIKAAEILERDHGINCNLTLLFSKIQAIACAQAGVTLISPFVGRILDWHKNHSKTELTRDPGVESVREIYSTIKQGSYKTKIMAASFRSTGEITELAGCDYLTISPQLLEELSTIKVSVEKKLVEPNARSNKALPIVEKDEFDQAMGENIMASELLTNGIHKFEEDAAKLKSWLKDFAHSST